MRLNELLNEKRSQAVMQYLSGLFPNMPEYVLRDLVYKNYKNDLKGAKEMVPNFGKLQWSKETLTITTDIFDEFTRKKLAARDGGSANPDQVPNDAERHDTQQKLIQTGPAKEPIILRASTDGYELIEGWHRTIQSLQQWPDGYKQTAWVGK
jgi:hypothetical protein